jgi:hypothetical protein
VDAVLAFVMTYLDPIGVVVGVLIAIPVVWTWWDIVVGQRRRRRRWFREARERAGECPAILIVDLLEGKDIRTAVERYRSQADALKAVPDDRVFAIRRDGRLAPDDMPGLVEEIRHVAGQIVAAGADVVHYFHAGPAVVAALAGAEFANGCRFLLYQHESTGYRNFGPLRMEV